MCLRTLPDLTNISWRMDIGLDITNLSWRMKSAKTVGKLDSNDYLARVGNVGNIAENSAEFNGTGANSLTSLTDLRWRETPGKVIEKLNFDNCLVKVDLRWREKSGKGVEKLYFNNYLELAEGERKMTRGFGRISTSAVKEKVYTIDGDSKKADGGDERKGGDGRDRDRRKGGDRRWRRYNW